MRLSELFGQTQRQAGRYPPEDGRHWLLRAAYWHETDRARLWLPLGMVLQKRLFCLLEAALQETALFQEADLPLAFPWPRRLPAGLEALLENQIASYRHLPRTLLLRRPHGLMALMLAETPRAALEAAQALQARWEAVLAHLGLPLRRGEGPAAANGHAALGLAAASGGEATLRCPQCGYEAPVSWARRARPSPEAEPPAPLTPVPTPHANTIQALADFLGVPASRTAKAVFLRTHEAAPRLVFAVVRGDMQVSLPKLAHLLGVDGLAPATDDDIRAVGAVPGYASPVGVRGALVVVDDLIPRSPNLVAGANREGYHLTGVNYGRDFTADLVADIAAAAASDPCPHCGAPLESAAAWVVTASQGLENGATYLATTGKPAPLGVAAAWVDGEAAVVALADRHHREDGLAWPPDLAPYTVHLIALRGGEDAAETLYADLQAAGFPVLYDDRKAGPGVKFTDADLMGMPLRVTVSKRSLKQGGVEIKPRTGEAQIVPPDKVADAVQQWHLSHTHTAP